MELRDYLAVVARRKWLIILTLVVVTVIAATVTAFRSPTYTASSTVRVATPASVANANILGSTDYMDRLQNTYSKLVTSDQTRDAIKRRLKVSSRPAISVNLRPNTELMDVQADAPKPGVAAAAANLAVDLLIAQVRQLGEQSLKQTDAQFRSSQSVLQKQIAAERVQDNALLAKRPQTTADKAKIAELEADMAVKTIAATQQQTAYEANRASILDQSNLITVVTPATAPTSPSGPKMKLAIALGLFVGLIGGLGLAFLFENLSTRMEATEDIERAAEMPVLGAIPVGVPSERGLFNSGSPTEEAFRRLRTNVLALERAGTPNLLLVTSAEPNEGKSTVVANLAVTLAQTGLRVVVVDGDLRLPTINTIFNVPNTVGFGDVLKRTARLEDAIVKSWRIQGLSVLPAGGPFDHPAELLASPTTGQVLAELAERFDVVLVDSPALLALADALSLATEIPDVLIVVGRSQTRKEALLSVRKQLVGIGAHPLGIVVNRSEEIPSYHYYNRR